MVYQNNNNRITPDAIQGLNLKTFSSPVDKSIQYQFNNNEYNKKSSIAEGLIQLGKGTIDYNSWLQQSAEQNVIGAYSETKAKDNKKQWADVSAKINGIAKFNPYNKDKYKELVGDDIIRAAELKMVSKPNIHMADETQYKQFVDGVQAEMMSAIKNSELEPRHLTKSLQKFDEFKKVQYKSYVEKNADYNYNKTKIKLVGDTCVDLLKDGQMNPSGDKVATFTQILQNSVSSKYEGLYTPDKAAVLLKAAESFITTCPTKAEAVVAALANVKFEDGTCVQDYDPNYIKTITDLARAARAADFKDKQLQRAEENFQIEENKKNFHAEMYEFHKQKPNATPTECNKKAQELIEKYGLKGEALAMFQSSQGYMTYFDNLTNIKTDKDLLSDLISKAYCGNLTAAEIDKYADQRKLNPSDVHSLYAVMEHEKQKAEKEKTEVKGMSAREQFNLFNKNIKDPNMYKKMSKGNLEKAINYAQNYYRQVSDGTLTLEEYTRKMNQLYKDLEGLKNIQNHKFNKADLLNATYLKTQKLPASESKQDATNTIRKLGFVARSLGESQIEVTDTPRVRERHPVTGKANVRHLSYDVVGGSRIRNTNKPAKVIFAGYEKTMGNYAVLEYENIGYVRMMHLKENVSNLQGKTLKPYQAFATMGATGYATGVHLDISFFNSKGILINAGKFRSIAGL